MRNRTNKQLVIGMAVLISLVMIGIGGKVCKLWQLLRWMKKGTLILPK
ncbi:hypothetical protein I587_00834 [Enterococcus mundtii ATCC 882]|nr:hypothetical protein I587_00834 [Enterococcus mundtii ATCC 882]